MKYRPLGLELYRSMVGCLPQLRLWVQSLGLQKLKTTKAPDTQMSKYRLPMDALWKCICLRVKEGDFSDEHSHLSWEECAL